MGHPNGLGLLGPEMMTMRRRYSWIDTTTKALPDGWWPGRLIRSSARFEAPTRRDLESTTVRAFEYPMPRIGRMQA